MNSTQVIHLTPAQAELFSTAVAKGHIVMRKHVRQGEVAKWGVGHTKIHPTEYDLKVDVLTSSGGESVEAAKREAEFDTIKVLNSSCSAPGAVYLVTFRNNGWEKSRTLMKDGKYYDRYVMIVSTVRLNVSFT